MGLNPKPSHFVKSELNHCVCVRVSVCVSERLFVKACVCFYVCMCVHVCMCLRVCVYTDIRANRSSTWGSYIQGMSTLLCPSDFLKV